MCDTPRCGPSAGLRSKIILSQKKGGSTYNLLKEYVLFSNSFCTHVTDSENFIDKLRYWKGCYIYIMREVMLEDVAAPP
jgi:hypothetical protein